MKIINKKENMFGDGIAFTEQWDFSRANLSEENRIKAITQVASICYQNPKALGSESLYNRLMAESMGLPSSSFEFVPVLLTWGETLEVCNKIEQVCTYTDSGKFYGENDIKDEHVLGRRIETDIPNIEKFGEWIEVDGARYLLTNYRALVYDFEQFGERGVDLRQRFNTEEECQIIKDHFKVFLYKVDFPTRSQMVRHRVCWQELSRRYVSGKKTPFQFYISDKMKDVKSKGPFFTDRRLVQKYNEQGVMEVLEEIPVEFEYSTQDLINLCMEHYYQALEAGVKPQEARRIIPQAAYTQIWGAFQPRQLKNFYKLRLDKTAQYEIRLTAEAMKELDCEKYD